MYHLGNKNFLLSLAAPNKKGSFVRNRKNCFRAFISRFTDREIYFFPVLLLAALQVAEYFLPALLLAALQVAEYIFFLCFY
jgi:hypothetical protein